MRVSQAKELFRSLTSQYFTGAEVTFTRQSRAAKPKIPLVTITPGNVKRPLAPVYKEIDGRLVGHYLSRISFQVDLFTNGLPVIDEDTGQTVAYENTAMDDMLAFEDFLNSEYAIEWSHNNDVSISFDGDAQDLTGLVNDNNYEFRARLPVLFYFTQKVIGHAALHKEDSIEYPTVKVDPDTGEPVYDPETGEPIFTTTTEEPKDTESTSGIYTGTEVTEEEAGTIVVEKHEPTSSGGGGSEELADMDTGYFVEAEIKEDKRQ